MDERFESQKLVCGACQIEKKERGWRCERKNKVGLDIRPVLLAQTGRQVVASVAYRSSTTGNRWEGGDSLSQ